ncbi:MAG: glycosyltransferase [Promethearchaeota archaeon]
MKIAIILSAFPVYSQTFILNQITGILDFGHELDIYAGLNQQEKLIQPDVIKYNLINRTTYFSGSSLFSRILRVIYLIFTRFYKDPKKILKAIKILIIRKDKLFLSKLSLAILFLKKNYDIIHCHFGNIGILGAFLKEIGINGKLITSFYGFDLTSWIKEHGKNIYYDLFKVGSLFISICSYFKKILMNLGCDERKLIVHHLGIDLDKFNFDLKSKSINSEINLLSIGRFVEKKGFEYSIRAISKLKIKAPKTIYRIVGDGPLFLDLKHLIQKLHLNEKVILTGALNRNEIINLYKVSDIFILPSITTKEGNQEGTPTVLLEAQSMGLPVISTKHSGIPEIVNDSISGYLVPERDTEAIVEKLEMLIFNRQKIRDMGLNGQKFIINNFGIKNLNRKLLKYYENLL